MEPPKRLKKPPPIPKFQQPSNDQQLQHKLSDFLNEIQKEAEVVSAPPPPKVDKAKLTLASINSKLNNMLSSKKISLNTAPKVRSHEEEEKVIKNESDYDPHFPNNYELSKHIYQQKFAWLLFEEEKKGRMDEEEVSPLEGEEFLEQKEEVALKMMQKYGYKVGDGLGKSSQGIKTPLIAKKTTDSACVIEQSAIPLSYIIRPEKSIRLALEANKIPITSVLVFIDLFSLDQLTQQVEKELKQECQCYGLIKQWTVYLFKNELRLFIAYESKEQAFTAFTKMNHKYYEQKLASLRFFSEEEFQEGRYDAEVHGHIVA